MPATTRTRGPLVVLALALAGLSHAQPPTPDQQAAALLAVGQKAYNDANPPLAAEKFREFLQKFGGHKDANAARYGLGLALLDLPDRDFAKAAESFTPPAADANFPDRAFALYYLAASHRGLGQKEIDAGAANPNDSAQRMKAAQRFAEAAKHFAAARDGFEKREPPEPEWAARGRADLAEMELRLGKFKEAFATSEPFAKDPTLAKSKSRPLGLYHHGFACFQLNDLNGAGRALGPLAPFDQEFGPHARYLLGRVHAAAGENAEANAAFEAVLAGFEKQKKDAAAALQQPDRFKNNPWERARLDALVKGAVPEYVAGAAFHAACLQYEGGRFGEALPKFQAFAKEYAKSPLAADAALRAGFCLVQTKQLDEAAKVLKPVADQQRRLSDQAMYWLGKAQVGQALAVDPNNEPARKQAFAQAVNTLRTAAQRAAELSGQDPDAKVRRGEILLELADALLTAKQNAEAANAYLAIWNEKLLPAKAEETLQRVVTAYHLAGDVNSSDTHAAQFRQQFPQSTLTPLVMFRVAENAYLKAQQAAKQNPSAAKSAFADSAKKYEEVAAKFPEFERVGRARYGLALCYCSVEDWEKAITAFESIALADRSGDLAAANYLLADCLIRTAPAKADDALADNMLREKLTNAAGLLEGFVGANPKAPEAADALLKLGFCNKRLGVQLADPKDRGEAFQRARAAYERLLKDYPKGPEAEQAALERGKVMSLQGDKGGATNALRAFTADPLRQAKIAPLACVALATLLREQNQAPAAVTVLQEARQRYEGPLAGDPQRVEWVALLRYHHGAALLESGKPAEARTAFDQAMVAAGARPIAVDAAVKVGLAHAEEIRLRVETIAKDRGKPGLNPAQLADIDARTATARREWATLAKDLERRAEGFKAAHAALDSRGRLLYDAAWLYRTTSPLAPLNPNGRPPTEADAKDKLDAEMVAAAKAAYAKLIAEFPDQSLAVDARFELAEVLTDHGSAEEATKLLREALDKEPADKPTTPEATERIRLRLGAALFAKGDFAAAQGQFDSIAANAKSPLLGQVVYRSGECLLAAGKAAEAVEKLKIYRDNGAFHNVPGVSDRAMLRLGHAYAALKQWEPSRQALEVLVARYGNSPWAADARYGMGWAFQNQGRYDEAVNQYLAVTQAVTDERAGRSHLQVGLCRAEQKRWADAAKAFLTVAYNFDLPELKYPALLEAARVMTEDKRPDEAAKLLERVLKDAPADGDYAKAAKERLEKVKK